MTNTPVQSNIEFLKDFNYHELWAGFLSSLPDWSHFYEFARRHSVAVIHSDDWQIRLSFRLVVCTLVNIVLIGVAWKYYGENVSTIFYNKPRTPERRLDNVRRDESLSRSMEELITKKEQ